MSVLYCTACGKPLGTAISTNGWYGVYHQQCLPPDGVRTITEEVERLREALAKIALLTRGDPDTWQHATLAHIIEKADAIARAALKAKP